MFILQVSNRSQGEMVIDGVPSAFVVSSAAVVGSHGPVSIGPAAFANRSEERPMPGGFDGAADFMAHAYLHAQKVGFVTGPSEQPGSGVPAPWTSNGAMLRAGIMGETMLVPSSASTTSSVTAAIPKVWWDFFQRRSKFEIYVEILELMKRGPMTPFEVAFYARLNHKRTKEYTEFLAKAGYLQAVSEDGRALYALTKDGLGFLDRVQSLLVGPGIIEVSPSFGYQRDF